LHQISFSDRSTEFLGQSRRSDDTSGGKPYTKKVLHKKQVVTKGKKKTIFHYQQGIICKYHRDKLNGLIDDFSTSETTAKCQL